MKCFFPAIIAIFLLCFVIPPETFSQTDKCKAAEPLISDYFKNRAPFSSRFDQAMKIIKDPRYENFCNEYAEALISINLYDHTESSECLNDLVTGIIVGGYDDLSITATSQNQINSLVNKYIPRVKNLFIGDTRLVINRLSELNLLKCLKDASRYSASINSYTLSRDRLKPSEAVAVLITIHPDETEEILKEMKSKDFERDQQLSVLAGIYEAQYYRKLLNDGLTKLYNENKYAENNLSFYDRRMEKLISEEPTDTADMTGWVLEVERDPNKLIGKMAGFERNVSIDSVTDNSIKLSSGDRTYTFTITGLPAVMNENEDYTVTIAGKTEGTGKNPNVSCRKQFSMGFKITGAGADKTVNLGAIVGAKDSDEATFQVSIPEGMSHKQSCRIGFDLNNINDLFLIYTYKYK